MRKEDYSIHVEMIVLDLLPGRKLVFNSGLFKMQRKF